MNNTLSIIFRTDGRVQTDIVTSDGVAMMEIHRKGLHDSKVLTALQERKFYQNRKGDWTLTFPDDNKVITKPTFDELVEAGNEFIFFRDNTIDYSGFC